MSMPDETRIDTENGSKRQLQDKLQARGLEELLEDRDRRDREERTPTEWQVMQSEQVERKEAVTTEGRKYKQLKLELPEESSKQGSCVSYTAPAVMVTENAPAPEHLPRISRQASVTEPRQPMQTSIHQYMGKSHDLARTTPSQEGRPFANVTKLPELPGEGEKENKGSPTQDKRQSEVTKNPKPMQEKVLNTRQPMPSSATISKLAVNHTELPEHPVPAVNKRQRVNCQPSH